MATHSTEYPPEDRFTIVRDGGQLVYYRFGPPGRKAILAIHGITAHHRAWQWFARTLVERGFTVFAVDLRGRGDSSGITGPFGFESHANDCIAVLNHAGVEEADLIGHSMGAFVVAAILAANPGKLVSRAVFIDGGVPLALPLGHTIETFMPALLGPALERLAMKFETKEAYQDYFKVHPSFTRGWNAGLSAYTDYDLRNHSPSTRIAAVEADSRDLFVSEVVVRGLNSIQAEFPVLLVRAERGLLNTNPLYSLEAIQEASSNYHIRVQTVPFNHYDIVLSQEGADACIQLIYS